MFHQVTGNHMHSYFSDRRRYRESYIYSDRYGEMAGLSDSLGGLPGYLGKTSADQRVSVISNTSSNTTSGIVSDRVLSPDGSEDDLDSEIMINTPPAASIENGVESLARSLSRLDSSSSSTHAQTPDYDEGSASHLSFTPPSSNSPAGGRMMSSSGVCGSETSGASLGRAGSVHSSSSQHSASTVRSRYSLVPHRLPPELTLGAELADLSLTPDLPHLADLPGMAAERAGRGEDEESELCAAISHTQHNCCSTCCDDNASITSGDDLEEVRDGQHCKCGSCPMCILQQASREFLHQKLDSENSSMAAQRGDTGPHTYHDSLDSASTSAHFYGGATFVSDDASVMVQPDLDESVTSTYNFSEEDFNQLDNNDDYVEFFKDGLRYPEQSSIHQERNIQDEDAQPSSVHRLSPQGLGAQGLGAQSAGSQEVASQPDASTTPTGSDLQDEEHLDYSVESAQAVLGASYSPFTMSQGRYRPRPSVSSTFDTDSDYVQVSGTEGHFLVLPPAPVSMSTVTTVTPVTIASSRVNAPLNETTSKNVDTVSSRSSLGLPEAVISETTVASASEAPAKFITSRPRITVLKAHTQQATTAAPSFTSVPLSRGMMNTLPQFQPRPRIDPVQSLQRGGVGQLPEMRPMGLPPLYTRDHRIHKAKSTSIPSNVEVPVIRKNNYLDVRASSSMNKHKSRLHPEQLPIVNPRSLYLRHQQKALQQEQLKQQQHLEQLKQRQSSENVVQPAAYAQGVGVPLLPSPTYTGYQHHQHSHSHNIQHPTHNFISPQHHQSQPHQALHQPPQQSYIYQPYIKNFFQNPPPPSPHHGYGVGAGPGGSGYQVGLEASSPTYQCASDPGTYPSHQQQHPLATVYTNQVSLSQIEQFKAQLYSDVDYVIYPMKDPALSRQEYMDAKQGQVIATQAQQGGGSGNSFAYLSPPPPYRGPKLSPIYRSTPNVAATLGSCSGGSTTSPVSGGSASLLSSYPSYQSLTSHQPGSSSGYSSMARGRYFSQQSLASSSLSSAPSGYSASTQSLSGSYEPYSEVMMRASSMMRVRSDESILSSTLADSSEAAPHVPAEHILPPPPPYRPKETLDNTGSALRPTSGSSGGRSRGRKSGNHLNLQQLRERTQLLDVPLITALCSDTTLVSHSSRTPSTDSSSTPNSSSSTAAPDQHHNFGTQSYESQDMDPVPAASYLIASPFSSASPQVCPIPASIVDASQGLAKPKPRCLKTMRKYSLSGVYTTNQIPITQIKSKSSGKALSGIHHHPSKAEIQVQPPNPVINDPVKVKVLP
ncbi:hypothetical protein SK128_014894 [Halocaridina rubra]|uniref:Uncharacterized protein n=1 Tax=Halocaridina rubra TaxID=373956 RepID=A0AAN9A1I5_HALRR